jgi:hypothetical protein
MKRHLVLLTLFSVAALAAVPGAFGSAIVGRGVAQVRMRVDGRGHAYISYLSRGRKVSLAAWGAVNARPPVRDRPQVEFHLRYGERGKGVCSPYDGPWLPWLIKACKAPDGTYWALQFWQRLKPNYGGSKGVGELHLSHWRGPLPQLVVYQNWTPGGLRHIFGRFTYAGQGVFGFRSTTRGSPLDGYGRNVYLDTFDSAYGKGWRRENAFLTHRQGQTPGDFCYGFFPHSAHPSGEGTRYRAVVEGPGVTPDVMWQGDDVGPYDPALQNRMLSLERSWGDPKCRN